jgi:hypothetical protein
VSPDLPLHPILNIAKAWTGVPDPKIIHPASQNGIDQGYHPTHGLGVEATKHFLEFPKKSRPGLLSWPEPNSPSPPSGFSYPEVEAQKAEGLVPGQIYHPSFIRVYLYLKLMQFLQ